MSENNKKHALDLQIIEAVYDTVHSGSDWGQVTALMCQSFDSPAAGFFEILIEESRKHRDAIYTFKGIAEDSLKIYDAYYASVNPTIATEGFLDSGILLSDDKLESFAGNRKVWTHSEYYDDWLKPLDLHHTMGVNLENRSGDVIHFTMIRPKKIGYYSEEEKKRLWNLFSHLKRGIDLKRKLNLLDIDKSVNESALYSLGVGIITLDSHGKIIFINDIAKNLSNRKLFRIINQKLQFNNTKTQAKYSNCLKSAISERSTQYLSAQSDSGSHYSMTISGLSERRSGFIGAINGATIYICSNEPKYLIPPRLLMEKWGLTLSEAKLAALLVNGIEIRKAADILHISYETARYYSKRIYQKAEVNSQTTLIKKGLSDCGLILGSSLLP